MNALLLNRDGFQMPADGWFQLAPFGEFPHSAAGVVQVVDEEACTAMAARFKADAAVANFSGLLVDFDHFSLDGEKRSEAAGWITDLECRPASPDGSAVSNACPGLWAKIRWSDIGEQAVKGGRYRFLSPVWALSDCVDLGNGRVRPMRLLNAAVTNDPNLKGLRALSNSARDLGPETIDRRPDGKSVDSCASNRGAENKAEGGDLKPEMRNDMKKVIDKLMNHLGLPGDASEDLVLEKMSGLPGLTAVSELQNSLKMATDERDALKTQLNGLNVDLVNRDLAEFEGVISDATKPFWTEQLLKNRDTALAALRDVAPLRDAGSEKAEGKDPQGKAEDAKANRKPLHNRAAARPVVPVQGGVASGVKDSRAVKIRNRAHEIARGDKVAFSVAFRRAEKEFAEG
jgi:phage I-like protein